MVASQETREKFKDEIVSHYYKEFVKALKSVGLMTKPPGILDLNVEMLKNGFLEVLIAICFLPFFFMDVHIQDPDLAYEDSPQGASLRKQLYQHPKFKELITTIISEFLYKGLLN